LSEDDCIHVSTTTHHGMTTSTHVFNQSVQKGSVEGAGRFVLTRAMSDATQVRDAEVEVWELTPLSWREIVIEGLAVVAGAAL